VAGSADLDVAGLQDKIGRIRDDDNVLVPNKTLRGLVAALDIVLSVYAESTEDRATDATAAGLRLVPSPKPRGRK
jgi:hypothetical protein